MLSIEELLGIICTEAIEHGGVQEVPAYKDGAKQSFHAAKRAARGPTASKNPRAARGSTTVKYRLRLVQERNGKLLWKE
jgi:hypothetical protein